MYCWENNGLFWNSMKSIFLYFLFLLSQCLEGSIHMVSGHDNAESLIYSPASPARTAWGNSHANSRVNLSLQKQNIFFFFFFAKICVDTELNELLLHLDHFISFASKQRRITLGAVCREKNPFRQLFVPVLGKSLGLVNCPPHVGNLILRTKSSQYARYQKLQLQTRFSCSTWTIHIRFQILTNGYFQALCRSMQLIFKECIFLALNLLVLNLWTRNWLRIK